VRPPPGATSRYVAVYVVLEEGVEIVCELAPPSDQLTNS